jgi:hypothetical protein
VLFVYLCVYVCVFGRVCFCVLLCPEHHRGSVTDKEVKEDVCVCVDVLYRQEQPVLSLRSALSRSKTFSCAGGDLTDATALPQLG